MDGTETTTDRNQALDFTKSEQFGTMFRGLKKAVLERALGAERAVEDQRLLGLIRAGRYGEPASTGIFLDLTRSGRAVVSIVSLGL